MLLSCIKVWGSEVKKWTTTKLVNCTIIYQTHTHTNTTDGHLNAKSETSKLSFSPEFNVEEVGVCVCVCESVFNFMLN